MRDKIRLSSNASILITSILLAMSFYLPEYKFAYIINASVLLLIMIFERKVRLVQASDYNNKENINYFSLDLIKFSYFIAFMSSTILNRHIGYFAYIREFIAIFVIFHLINSFFIIQTLKMDNILINKEEK